MGPHGAHARLQHGPPQGGTPASVGGTPPSLALLPQSCPSTSPQLAGPPGDDASHVPNVCPEALVQAPVQQSAAAEQASPGWPQNEDA